ncbi:hypothetical protein HDE_01463 [Halotydeus destructor]|nr:hypothetical protein HDE_01463 [Halotydeus destructor]
MLRYKVCYYLKQWPSVMASCRHVSSVSMQQSDGSKLIDVVNMGSIWTNPTIPYKIGYTDVMPTTPDQVVSSHDEHLLLQYWPRVFQFQAADVNCAREAFKKFTSNRNSWTTADLGRHDDHLSHESTMFGRQGNAERRLYAILANEAIFLIDDLVERLMTSADKDQEAMGLDLVRNVRDITSGTAGELDHRFESTYKHKYPEDYEACRYVADFNARLHQGLKSIMSADMLKFVSRAFFRSHDRSLDEYKFWKDAISRNEHASYEHFVAIKSEASFFSVNGLTNYNERDIQYIHFDHPILILAGLINQASNDLYSYPKEQAAGLNPYNMIQKAIMADKMSLKEALIVNIHRRNEYMRTLEISYDVLQGDAKLAAEAPLTIMAGWEKYFRETRRYGWTNIGEPSETLAA